MTKDFSLSALQLLLIQIPKGKVTTYKEIAKAMGSPKGARAVGNLLNKNPDPDKYPCCKVVKSTGEIGGFATGTVEKIKRLKKEGIKIKDGKVVDFEERIFQF